MNGNMTDQDLGIDYEDEAGTSRSWVGHGDVSWQIDEDWRSLCVWMTGTTDMELDAFRLVGTLGRLSVSCGVGIGVWMSGLRVLEVSGNRPGRISLVAFGGVL